MLYKISIGELTIITSTETFTIPATSGRDAIVSTKHRLSDWVDGEKYMNNYKYIHVKDLGPICLGIYKIDLKDYREPNVIKNTGRNILHGDLGKWRVPLRPTERKIFFNAEENIEYERKDFFLHGGKSPGSAGCIDVGERFPLLGVVGMVAEKLTPKDDAYGLGSGYSSANSDKVKEVLLRAKKENLEIIIKVEE